MKLSQFNGQLEMSFAAARGCASTRQRRQNRAQWWFQRMRQVVDSAVSCPASAQPDPQPNQNPAAI